MSQASHNNAWPIYRGSEDRRVSWGYIGCIGMRCGGQISPQTQEVGFTLQDGQREHEGISQREMTTKNDIPNSQ